MLCGPVKLATLETALVFNSSPPILPPAPPKPSYPIRLRILRLRREAAGEPPLPVKPGSQRVYKYKLDDDVRRRYVRRWVPDDRAELKHQG
jgi:hypothetical protein